MHQFAAGNLFRTTTIDTFIKCIPEAEKWFLKKFQLSWMLNSSFLPFIQSITQRRSEIEPPVLKCGDWRKMKVRIVETSVELKDANVDYLIFAHRKQVGRVSSLVKIYLYLATAFQKIACFASSEISDSPPDKTLEIHWDNRQKTAHMPYPSDFTRLQPTVSALNIILKPTNFKDDLLDAGSKAELRIQYKNDMPVMIFNFREPSYDFLELLKWDAFLGENSKWLAEDFIKITLVLADSVVADKLSTRTFTLDAKESETLRNNLAKQKSSDRENMVETEAYIYANLQQFI